MTDCHVVELSFPKTAVHMIFKGVDYANAFNVFYTNKTQASETSKSEIDCKNFDCLITYSSDGKVINGPVAYTPCDVRNSSEEWRLAFFSDSLALNSVYYSRYYIKFFEGGIGVLRVDQNAVGSEVFTSNYTLAGQSVSNSKLSLCAFTTRMNYDKNLVTCSQHDSKNNDKVLVNFNLSLSDYAPKAPYQDVRIEPYNLQDGNII